MVCAGFCFFLQISIFWVFWTCTLLTGGPRRFEDGLSQAFADLAGRGASGSSVFAEPAESPGNG